MEIWQISVLIIAVAVLLLVIFMLPMLVQLRRSVKKIEDISHKLDRRLPTILANVDAITSNVNAITTAGKKQAETIGGAVNQFKGMVDDVFAVEQSVKRHMDTRLIRSLTTITAGARAAHAFISVMRNGKDGKSPKTLRKRRLFRKAE